MVRIIPRLRSAPTGASGTTSRNSSPRRGSKASLTGLDGPKETGLCLKVGILRARNLAPKDRRGTSDPYLILTLGEAKHQTHAIDRTLNPEWNESCQMPITATDGSLLLDVCCWDKDRLAHDYMGEFDVPLESIFAHGKTEHEPRWYRLKSKRSGRKSSVVSGEVLLQFTLLESSNTDAPSAEVRDRFQKLVKSVASPARNSSPSSVQLRTDEDDADEEEDDEDSSDSESISEDSTEKKKRKLRIKGLRRKKRDNPYEFTHGDRDVAGIIYLEICNIVDLPPESNVARSSFAPDPFVIASLGKKTYRTKVVRSQVNPVFHEKMIFQVLAHEQQYSFSFTVIDHDRYSANDFLASAVLPVKELIEKSPKADPETGLYELREPPDYSHATRRKVKRTPLARNASGSALSRATWSAIAKSSPLPNNNTLTPTSETPSPAFPSTTNSSPPARTPADSSTDLTTTQTAPPTPGLVNHLGDMMSRSSTQPLGDSEPDEPDFTSITLPLKMKNPEGREDKYHPQLFVRAKYMPYPALRQQFWRAMLKQYDADESGRISKVELTTMLDTLGSTLRESTINSFFRRFPHRAAGDDSTCELTMDEVVICLENQLERPRQSPSVIDRVKGAVPDTADQVKRLLRNDTNSTDLCQTEGALLSSQSDGMTATSLGSSQSQTRVPSGAGADTAPLAEDVDISDRDEFQLGSSDEEHVIEIRECPICHQPRLNKRKDADIITHIATCASQDWRQVDSLMMGGFVTASQAQRKWYSKVVTKISYGGYKLGANSANILVQDRITGQISEEKMSVYVRLGIRLLYKGLKANKMEDKRIRKLLKSLSVKQGRKYDSPASKCEIQKFIEFHQLDTSEVLLPLDGFKNFNEFFYRALKPGARPVSAPDNPRIIVSPADCRSVVFNRLDIAQRIWIKGREFSVRRLIEGAYPDDVERYENGGALAIFRLAPQDYHRFHIPVDGVIGTPKYVAGEYYTVNPMAVRSALDVYGENVRVIMPIDSVEHGRVMIICVGAMMVGSTIITRQAGETVQRGEELGYFKFGGSTLVMLFEEGRMVFDDDLVDNSLGALETLVRVGMSVGHSPNEPQWTPDMPKNVEDVTREERVEAKRRIVGGINPGDSPDDSVGDAEADVPAAPGVDITSSGAKTVGGR